MAQQRNLPQSKEVLLKSYNTRLKEDCKIMLENYFGKFGANEAEIDCYTKRVCKYFHKTFSFQIEIIKLAKGESDSQLSKITQCEQDTYEMQVRASNIGKYGIQSMKSSDSTNALNSIPFKLK